MPDVSRSLRDAIRSIVAEHNPDAYEAEGDQWLFRPDPDSAELSVDGLTDALVHEVNRWFAEAFK